MVSIRSKLASRFQVFCSSSICKRRIHPSLCIAASFLARILSRRCQLAAYTSAMIFLTSLPDRHFLNKMKKRSVTRVNLCVRCPEPPSWRSPVVQVPSGSLAIAALATILRSVSSLHWRSPSQRSRLLASGRLMRQSFKTIDVSPSCFSDWGRRVSYFQANLPWLMLWWRTRRAPLTGGSYHTGASSQCSRTVPRPVVFDVLALTLLELLAVPIMFPAFWQVGTAGFPLTPGYSTPNPSSPLRVFALVQQSSRSCGRWFLTNCRYPQSALAWWCLRQCALQQRSFLAGSLAQTSYRRVAFGSSKALISSSNLK